MLKQLIRRIINCGILLDDNPGANERIRLINTICLFAFIVVCIISIYLYYIGTFDVFVFVAFCFCFTIPLVANYYRSYKFSRFALYIGSLAGIATTMTATPDKIIYFLFTIMVLPYLFDKQKVRFVLLTVTVMLPLVLISCFDLDISSPSINRQVLLLISSAFSIILIHKLLSIRTNRLMLNKELLKQLHTQRTTLDKKQKDLNGVNRQLEIQNNELENFIYIASHDLKQPIRNTISYVQLLIMKLTSTADKEYKSQLQLLESNAMKINNTINDLLVYSRIGIDAVFTEFNLEVLTKECIRKIKQKATLKVSFELDCDLKVYGNRKELKRLIIEILNNSVKAKKETENLIIQLNATKNVSNTVCTISDNGKGIPEDKIDTIENLFVSGGLSSSGMGLGICRKIVDQHRGSFSIRNKKSGGVRVTFSITNKGQ